MSQLKLVSRIQSALDNTVKYTFLAGTGADAQAVEFSYIDKNDGKHIICVPTQTSCKMGCKFCHLTGLDIPVRNLSFPEIEAGVNYVVEDLTLMTRPRTLLISYMGCGEPLNNTHNVIESARGIRRDYTHYCKVRFAISTMVPDCRLFYQFSAKVEEHILAFKAHLSLHSPFNYVRVGLMPAACNVREALFALRAHKTKTGNDIEIHYALIAGVNDTTEDLRQLCLLLQNDPIPVKFLAYNPKPGTSFKRSERLGEFMRIFWDFGISCEYYLPPGSDIGSSCGQFLTDNLRTAP